MTNMGDFIKNFNKKRYRRIINKHIYSFIIDSCPVSTNNYTMLFYGVTIKNRTTKKSLLYYIPFSTIYKSSKQNCDKDIVKYITRKIIVGNKI